MVTYATGAGPYSVAVGDFNRDGNADIVVAAAIAGGVNVHLGHGDATFAPPVEYTTGVASEHVTVADFDDDERRYWP